MSQPLTSLQRAAPFALAAALLALQSNALAQSGPVRSYSKPLAELSEPYTSVRGVRELADGRAVVVDPRDKIVQIVDFKTGRVVMVGREGSGPNEYQMPSSAFALPGDSTLIPDVLNSRFLLLGAGGKPAGTWSPAAVAASGAGAAPRIVTRAAPPAARRAGAASGPSFVMGGPGGPMSMLSTRAVDAQGRVYGAGAPIVIGPNGPQGADSVPITRTARKTMVSDTVAWLQIPKGNAQVSGGAGNMNIRIGGTPFAAEDGWTVLPDGRVAVVRHANYQLEVYPASGKGAPLRGAPVKTPPLRVGNAEKEAWRESRRSAGQMAIAVTQDGASSRRTQASAAPMQQPEPDSWPAVLPAFQGNQVFSASNVQIWVGRYRAANDANSRFDVFEDTGKHVGQVVFPARTSVVGFGKGVVYTVRMDEDDLQYLQRFALQ